MAITHRFGKRIPLPSTRQIRHELILLWAADELKKSEARAAAAPAPLRPEMQTSAPKLPS
jgi:hypothetical protein